MNEEILISVIVPVYNVADFLEECVDSILGQTYPHLEVLLIDDGSPDTAPHMCDAYAMGDNRVRVIHKENGGLSDARNVGIEHASGDWLLFVDGDDYIEPDMVETLLSAALDNNVSIAMCGACTFRISDAGRINNYAYISTKSCVADGIEILKGVNSDGNLPVEFVVAWNKLYHRRIFDSLRYPVGRIREDEAVVHRILGMSQQIACVDSALYNYRQREGSIVTEKSMRQMTDIMEAYADRALYYDVNGFSDYSHPVFEAFFGELLYFYGTIKADVRARNRIPGLLKWARKLLPFYLRHKEISIIKRAAVLFFTCIPDVYWLAIKLIHFVRHGNTHQQRDIYE